MWLYYNHLPCNWPNHNGPWRLWQSCRPEHGFKLWAGLLKSSRGGRERQGGSIVLQKEGGSTIINWQKIGWWWDQWWQWLWWYLHGTTVFECLLQSVDIPEIINVTRIHSIENDFEDKNEERMTHVLILYFRYFAHTNLAATILLFVEIVIMLWEQGRPRPVLLPRQAAPAHLLEEDDDAWDQLRTSLLQLKQSGGRPEQSF